MLNIGDEGQPYMATPQPVDYYQRALKWEEKAERAQRAGHFDLADEALRSAQLCYDYAYQDITGVQITGDK
ncbi:hypothetical protein SEA_JONJAMES_195 [Gordonia Phage JonJames]|nr:hypothetical protein SEA_JONJAMES_195 [Gordonia Phage JonJames]